jgi:hypothetical protein
MTTAEYIDGLDGWFQPWAEHNTKVGSRIKVGGTYTIYTGRLSEEQLDKLGAILAALAGTAANDTDGIEVSFEPSGVTVSGEATAQEWQAWDTTFRTFVDAEKLPRFPA